jgi:hypothetical protein
VQKFKKKKLRRQRVNKVKVLVKCIKLVRVVKLKLLLSCVGRQRVSRSRTLPLAVSLMYASSLLPPQAKGAISQDEHISLICCDA